MTSSDEYLTKAQDWSVRFNDKGKELFLNLGGTPTLADWHFRVSMPEREGRTEKELVDEVRSLGIDQIHRECEKCGLQIPFDVISQLNSHEYLEGAKA